MDKYIVKILIGLIVVIYTFVFVSILRAESNPVEVLGFYVGQTTQDVKKVCNKIDHSFSEKELMENASNLTCSSKIHHFSLLTVDNKVIGIHGVYFNDTEFNRTVEKIFRYGIVKAKEETVDVPKIGNANLYTVQNLKIWFDYGNEFNIVHLEKE